MRIAELKYDLRRAGEISRDLIIIEDELTKTSIEEEREMLRKSYASLLEQLKKINDSIPGILSDK